MSSVHGRVGLLLLLSCYTTLVNNELFHSSPSSGSLHQPVDTFLTFTFTNISEPDNNYPSYQIENKPKEFHQHLLSNIIFNTTGVLQDLGVLGSCGHSRRNEIFPQISESLEHLLISKTVSPKEWKEEIHPVHKLFQTIRSRSKRQCAPPKIHHSSVKRQVKQFIQKLNPEVVEFLSNLVQNSMANYIDHTSDRLNIIFYLCKNFLRVRISDIEECIKDFEFTVNQTSIGRMRRSVDANRNRKDNAIKKRQGYESHGSGPGGNYVVLEQTDTAKEISKLEKAIKKLLGSAAIGAWISLGLIGYRILNAIANGTGSPGDPGNNGTNGVKGLRGPSGVPGSKGMKGMLGMKGLRGNLGITGEKGLKGVRGFKGLKGVQGTQGVDGPPGENGDQGVNGNVGEKGFKGEKGLKGDIGEDGSRGRRRRRSAMDNYNLLDTNTLLNDLYRQKRKDRTTVRDIETAINELWQEKKRPVGCFDCTLFTALNDDNFTDLDRYILTSFSQLLGNHRSSQMLQDVARGKRGGYKLTCQRRGSSCHLQYHI